MPDSHSALSYPKAIGRISVLIASGYRSHRRKDVLGRQQPGTPGLDGTERNESASTAREIASDGLVWLQKGRARS